MFMQSFDRLSQLHQPSYDRCDSLRSFGWGLEPVCSKGFDEGWDD